ncbi:Alpha/Beta hydrolase protein [Xylariaceae sp. FL0016]|nr:Alpha/Beta hydrolase protein [Xylariaceae sp. FL0016]
MAPEALSINDSRVEHRFLEVSPGIRYHYLLASPEKRPIASVLLLHGWPDLSMGWRFQVPHLVSLGLRVIMPDMLGYGRTSAPGDIEAYALKNVCGHLVQLIHEVVGEEDAPVILGGHDWGAQLAWRFTMYHPGLVRAVFGLCVPFAPPQRDLVTMEEAVARSAVLGYQVQNARGEAERLAGASRESLRGWLRCMGGARTPEGLPGFEPGCGIVPGRLLQVGESPLVASDMLEYYVSEFSRNGLRGPMNWYRTRTLNWEDELPFATKQGGGFKFSVPAMLVLAGQDPVFPPESGEGQEEFFAAGLKKEVIPEASHVVLIHCPEEVNRHIEEFVGGVLGLKRLDT